MSGDYIPDSRDDYVRAGYLPEWEILEEHCDVPPSFEVFAHFMFSFPARGPRFLASKIAENYARREWSD